MKLQLRRLGWRGHCGVAQQVFDEGGESSSSREIPPSGGKTKHLHQVSEKLKTTPTWAECFLLSLQFWILSNSGQLNFCTKSKGAPTWVLQLMLPILLLSQGAGYFRSMNNPALTTQQTCLETATCAETKAFLIFIPVFFSKQPTLLIRPYRF